MLIFIHFEKATNEVITQVPKATQEEMEKAVQSCERAFKTWSETTVLTRQQMAFKLQQLIKDNLVTISRNTRSWGILHFEYIASDILFWQISGSSL